MAKAQEELKRRFPDDERSRQTVATVVERAAEGAKTEDVRKALNEPERRA